MKRFNDEVFDVALKYAGHDMLAETEPDGPGESANTSELFDKRMCTLIGRSAARRRAYKALKITARVAAILAIFVVISTAVIFSSEALRVKVTNLFYEIGGGQTSISFTGINGELPEGIVIPDYLPAGYEFADATKTNQTIESLYENAAGDTITIRQGGLNREIKVDSDASYVTEIAGRTAYVVDDDEYKVVIFNNDWYCFIMYGKVDVSELLVMAESMLD